MIVVDRMLKGGLGFVFRRLMDAVDAELNDEDGLRERLLSAQLQLEEGEISDEAFSEVEAEVFARLREIRAARDGGEPTTLDAQVVGVEATFESDDGEAA